MKRTTLRAAGASALAAVAFGFAAPAAHAATSQPVRTVAVVQVADVQQAPGVGGPSPVAGSEDGWRHVVEKAWEAIKKSGLARKAWEAAKGGQTSFWNWVNSLSNANPVKWTIKALPGAAVQELIAYILEHYTG
ncbi:hypothetical protein [Streptomyces sp. 2P-4]|uniref:hypothetical protein n=1 Tax=Streptomyces sp. 2P-4 TaxID=2931974 RepID=UPI00253FAFBB|nr:hypothetical protein [Streptomyces sp. 2P-4]